jgi:cytochrome P450
MDVLLVRERMRVEGRVLPVRGPKLGIFDPVIIAKLDRANFDGLLMQPRFTDVLRQRPDRCPVLWKDVRAALSDRTRKLGTPEVHQALHRDMVETIRGLSGIETDLTWLAERAISQTLIPFIIGGLSPADHRKLVRDQHTKIENVLTPFEDLLRGLQRRFPVLRHMRNLSYEYAAGRVIARQLRQRMRGRSPPRNDYAQAVLGLVDRLGVSRATYVVSTVLTAVAGAPGTFGACLLYEFLCREEWRERIRAEFSAITEEQLFREPVKSAPIAHRFVKEALRFWSFPIIAQRTLYKDIEVDEFRMSEGDFYFLSSYLIHRDSEYWDDPDTFDPERWARQDQKLAPGVYAPFGWGGRTCVGASLGLAQTMLFLQIVATRFDIEFTSKERTTVGLDGIAAPENFHGIVRERPAQAATPAQPASTTSALASA